jgi:hypothetical protein
VVDARLLRSLKWVLIVCGVVGLLGAASMFLVTLAQFGQNSAASSIADRLPFWTLLSGAPPSEIAMLIAGSLCALLLVAGRWPIKVWAVLTAAWFAYAQAAFGSGSHWAKQLEQTFITTPYNVAGLVGALALLVVSVLALVIAARPIGRGQSLPGSVPRAPVSDTAQPPLQ